MKFGKKEKKSKESKRTLVPKTVPFIPKYSNEETLKLLREKAKTRIKPLPCPYLEICDYKVLPEVGRVLCLDQESGPQSQAFLAHIAKHHIWEGCKIYVERLRKEKGILPKDVLKVLQKTKKK